MLTLALLRHAKSSWAYPTLDDFDRPLNARGAAAAPVMGRAIAELGIAPDLILCSTSRRTRETLTGLLPLIGHTTVEFEDRLYLASAQDLIGRLQHVTHDEHGRPSSVLVIGHNPGLHSCAVMLAGKGDARALIRLQDRFPTGALAVINFEARAWRDIAAATGVLERFITPKDPAKD